HQLQVVRWQIAALVEHRQAHDPEVQVDVPNLADLEDPARRRPRERADGVEVEVDPGPGGGSHQTSHSSLRAPRSRATRKPGFGVHGRGTAPAIDVNWASPDSLPADTPEPGTAGAPPVPERDWMLREGKARERAVLRQSRRVTR